MRVIIGNEMSWIGNTLDPLKCGLIDHNLSQYECEYLLQIRPMDESEGSKKTYLDQKINQGYQKNNPKTYGNNLAIV